MGWDGMGHALGRVIRMRSREEQVQQHSVEGK